MAFPCIDCAPVLRRAYLTGIHNQSNLLGRKLFWRRCWFPFQDLWTIVNENTGVILQWKPGLYWSPCILAKNGFKTFGAVWIFSVFPVAWPSKRSEPTWAGCNWPVGFFRSTPEDYMEDHHTFLLNFCLNTQLYQYQVHQPIFRWGRAVSNYTLLHRYESFQWGMHSSVFWNIYPGSR